MSLKFHDLHPKRDDLLSEVQESLSQSNKAISPKFFYDEKGSDLFKQITHLQEYYITETEMQLLHREGSAIGKRIGTDSVIIEYGSGSSEKIHLLLDHLPSPHTYVAIDISKEHLMEMTEELARAYPELEVHAICADFTAPLKLPLNGSHVHLKKIGFFPGSSIGNFDPREAENFLAMVRKEVGTGGGLLIGVDLKKDRQILHRAYNDSHGITAKFNKNLLERINRECQGDFDLNNFEHRAFYNQELGRVEMHLISKRNQTVKIKDSQIQFSAQESIHTENSYKYSIEEFSAMAQRAGWKTIQTWSDSEDLFSIHYFETI